MREALSNSHTLNSQKSQEFALDGGVIFDIFGNESHADGMFILALKCSILIQLLK